MLVRATRDHHSRLGGESTYAMVFSDKESVTTNRNKAGEMPGLWIERKVFEKYQLRDV